MGNNVESMKGAAVAVLALSAIVLTGIAVVTGFKIAMWELDPSGGANVTNASADKFIAGLTIFGTFMSIIVLAIVGKIIVGLFSKKD